MEVLLISKEAYGDLLELKNHISVKVRQITNEEVLNRLKQRALADFDLREIDYEPEYSFSDCIKDIVRSIWNEQETGEVNYIT